MDMPLVYFLYEGTITANDASGNTTFQMVADTKRSVIISAKEFKIQQSVFSNNVIGKEGTIAIQKFANVVIVELDISDNLDNIYAVDQTIRTTVLEHHKQHPDGYISLGYHPGDNRNVP